MGGVVADTHAVLWYLKGSPRISSRATDIMRECIQSAQPVYVASVTLVEIIYLVDKGRPASAELDLVLSVFHRVDSGFALVPLTLGVSECVRKIPYEDVPEMPDRIIAGTALYLQVPLVTRDRAIRLADAATIW